MQYYTIIWAFLRSNLLGFVLLCVIVVDGHVGTCRSVFARDTFNNEARFTCRQPSGCAHLVHGEMGVDVAKAINSPTRPAWPTPSGLFDVIFV